MSETAKLVEVARLAGLVCDNAFDDDDLAQLDALLLDDEDSQQYYLRQLDIDAALAWRGEDIVLPAELSRVTESWPCSDATKSLAQIPQRSAIAFGGLTRSAAASITLVAAVFYGTFAFVAWNLRPHRAPDAIVAESRKETTTSTAIPTSHVATLTSERSCDWSDAKSRPTVGTAIPAGFMAHLDRGTAEFTLASGAVVELTGPSMLETRSAGEVSLRFGQLTANVPPQAIGFTVTTPTATIVDLGTEFGVQTRADGATEVHVLRGTVEARSHGDKAPAHRITANQAAQIDAVAHSVLPIQLDADRFSRRLSGKRAPAAANEVISLALAEILPGTECTALVANGDFEERGPQEPPGSNQFPFPEVWKRDGNLFVGQLPESESLPAICGRTVALASLDGGLRDGLYVQPITLEPDTEYVLSGYLWNFGTEPRQAVANVDFEDAAGEANLRLLCSEASASLGRFAYQRFHTAQTGISLTLRVFFDTTTVEREDRSTGKPDMAWDRIAITKVSRFVPPLMRMEASIKTSDELK